MGKVEMPKCAEQEEVEEPAHRWFSQHRWYSDCGGLSQALTARSECYVTLVFVFAAFGCDLVATRLGD